MKQTICTVGDTIFHDGFPADYDLNPIRNVLAQADVRLFNLEIVVSDGAPFGSTYCGGTWILAKEAMLDDMAQYGFNGCSFANNHTMDYGYQGLFDTLAAAGKRGLPICGADKDLEEASDYARIETANGKCAVISLCATFNDAARAGLRSETVPGRPGGSPGHLSLSLPKKPALWHLHEDQRQCH